MPHKYDIDPDNRNVYMTTCPRCKQKYHASEVHECKSEDDDDYEPLDEYWGEGREADNAAESHFEDLERRRERGRG